MLPKFLSGFHRSKPMQVGISTSLRGTYVTNSGMLALWDPKHFAGIASYETWEAEMLEEDDIARHIEQGAYVPINIRSDVAFECEVRVGNENMPDELSPRESEYLAATSQPYLYRSHGNACLSGIERVEGNPPPIIASLSVPNGNYSATVHMLDWDTEPGAKDPDGKPSPGALPDFLILLNPVTDSITDFRKSVETFDRPSE
jgi:hypothetical protein